jgi:hypothetical protein
MADPLLYLAIVALASAGIGALLEWVAAAIHEGHKHR